MGTKRLLVSPRTTWCAGKLRKLAAERVPLDQGNLGRVARGGRMLGSGARLVFVLSARDKTTHAGKFL